MSRKLNTEGAFTRVGGLAGLGFATLIVLGNVILAPAGLPLTGAKTDAVVAFFSSKDDLVGVVSALTPIAWVMSTLFAAGAVSALRRSDQERGEAWSLVGFAGVLLQNGAFAGVIAIRLALARDSTASGALWALHDALFTLNGTFLALALIGFSISGLRAGLIRPWHSKLGLLSAALLLTSAMLAPLVIAQTGPLGLIGLIGWLSWVAWIVRYSVNLIRLEVRSRTSL